MSKTPFHTLFCYLDVPKARRSKAQHCLDHLGKKRHWFQNDRTLDGHFLPGVALYREQCHSVPGPIGASHTTEYVRLASIVGVPFVLSIDQSQ
jgi:hypothetical protein